MSAVTASSPERMMRRLRVGALVSHAHKGIAIGVRKTKKGLLGKQYHGMKTAYLRSGATTAHCILEQVEFDTLEELGEWVEENWPKEENTCPR